MRNDLNVDNLNGRGERGTEDLQRYCERLERLIEKCISDVKRESALRIQAEQALKQSNESYQFLTENIADTIYKINLDHEVFNYVSPAIEKLLGYTVQEAFARDIPDMLTPDSYQMQRSKIIEAMEGNQLSPIILELDAIHKGGHIVPVEAHVKFIMDEQGDPVEILGVVRDLSQRKQTEQALRESKNYLDVMFHSTLSGTMVIDAETHIITDVNETACKAIGLDKKEIIGHVCHNFVCPADRGKCPISDQGQTVDRSERQLLTHQGEACTILKTVKPITIGGHDYYIESFIDISDRKKSEERITALNRLNQQLLIAGNFEEKLHLITNSVTEIFQTDFTRIWLTRPGDLCDSDCLHAAGVQEGDVCKKQDRCLHLKASSGRYTHTGGDHKRVPFGKFKIGSIAAEEAPKYVTNDIANDPKIHNREWAQSLGLRSFAGYRLLSESGKPVGVMALFSRNEISPEEDALLESIASSAAHVVQVEQAREAMYANEKFLDAIIENIPDMIFVKEARDLRFVRFNQAAEKLLGYNKEELYGRNDYDFFPKNEAEFFIRKDQEVLRSGIVLDIPEETIHTREKGKRVLHTKKIPILGDDQEPMYLLGISEDITEKRDMEAIQRFQAQLMNQIHDSVIAVDMDGLIASWNKGSETLFHYQEDEVIGKPISMLYPQYTHAELQGDIIPTLLSEGRHGYETTLVRKGGGEFEALVSLSVLKDSEGNIEGMIGYTLDISDQKRAENELKLREQLLNFAIEQMPIPVIIASAPDVKITRYNVHAVNFLSKPINDLSSMVLDEHREFWPTFYPDGTPYDPEDLPLTRAVIKGETSRDVEIIIRKDDKDFWVSANAAPLFDDNGNIIAGIVVFPDITEIKKTAEEREQLIEELQSAIDKIQTLSGLLPICGSCKKIRDDQGYWNQIEAYISKRSKAEFSHSICPGCAKELYPDLDIY